MSNTSRSDDDLLADLLVHTWMLISGKMLPLGAQPRGLTEQELIDFWADDTYPPGKHNPAGP